MNEIEPNNKKRRLKKTYIEKQNYYIKLILYIY